LATATVLMVVRVPDTPEVTSLPLTVSLPLTAAAAGTAVAAEAASAIPTASSTIVTRDFMVSPRVVRALVYFLLRDWF